MVLGFSFQGTLIPAGNHVITNVTYEGENQSEFCLVNGVIDGLDVQYGGCTTVTQNPQAYVSFGDNTISTLDIAIISEVDIAGFQFSHNGCVSGASGGDAEANGFTISASGSAVLAFSFTGSVVPAGDGTLVILDGEVAEDCITNLIFSDVSGDALEVSFPFIEVLGFKNLTFVKLLNFFFI